MSLSLLQSPQILGICSSSSLPHLKDESLSSEPFLKKKKNSIIHNINSIEVEIKIFSPFIAVFAVRFIYQSYLTID